MPSYDPDFFNIDPYYDDFDESKKFLKMLFRPGVALQARELTQVQSILQNQIERFGNFVFDDGSMIFGGQITEIPTEVAFIESLSGGDGLRVTDLQDKIVTIFNAGETSHAKIIFGTKSPLDDSDIIYFQYLSGEGITNSGTIEGFNLGITFTASITTDTQSGMVVFVDSGIRYTNGYFVLHDAQRIGLFEENLETLNFTTPNRSVGFNVVKNIVTSQQDITLRDPASGFYNFNAPGSDRFKIDLLIAQKDLGVDSDTSSVDVFSRTDFIEFLRIVDGVVVKKEKYADLGEIEETFARRTYDESGHYVVDPFEITMIQGPTDDKLQSKLDSGKAYVFGYEFETIGSTKLTHDRARGADHESEVKDVEYGYSLGPYFLAKFTNISDSASGLSSNCKILFDSYSGYPIDIPFGIVDGVRISFTTEATTKDFIPGLTLYFADNVLDLTGGAGVEYPGASAGIQARILRVIPAGGTTSQQFTPEGFAYINAIEIGPPYITGNNWPGGITSSFLTTSPFYVAAGPSFEAGFDVTFTGSNVSFFQTLSENQFTGGDLNVEIGQARIRNFQKFSGSFYKVFLDDVSINEGRKFSDVKRIFTEGNTEQPALYLAEIPGTLYNLKNTSLVFESPLANVIKTIDKFDYMVDFTVENIQLSTSGSWVGYGHELNLENKISGLVQIGPNISSSSAFYNVDSSRIVSVFSKDGSINCEIRISGPGGSNVTNPKTLTIQNAILSSTGAPYTGKVTVVVACQVNQTSSRKKTLSTSQPITLDFTGPDEEGYYYSYLLSDSTYITDVNSIVSITPTLTGSILDNGQKNTYYDWSKIKVSYEPSEESYTAVVNHFVHSGFGPFIGGTGPNASYSNYETIPNFESPDGQTIFLRNSLDFRAVRTSNPDTFTLTGPYQYPSYVYDGYEQSVDYTHYLSRIDKIILTKDRNFKVIQGIPNEEPVSPSDDPNAMTLYTIRFNPYTFDENDVSILQEDNRRFTMRDIGNLERRIEKLEYYSTLSALEQEAKSTPIYDDYGLEIPKKAILVDQFTGMESADVSNQDFYCSIDRETKELRPPFEYFEVGYNNSWTISSGLTNNDGIITFDFSEEEFLSNTKNNSSRFINANKIVDFNGSIKLEPHCDPWFSTDKKPVVKTNFDGENDSWLIGSPSFQMNSDFAERGWFGKNSNGTKIEKKNTILTRDKKLSNSPISKISSFTIPQSNITSNVDRIVDSSVVPYCRDKTVELKVNGLKPNKLHYIYFEDELMNLVGITANDRGEIDYTLNITGGSHVAGKKLIRVLDNDENKLDKSSSSADAIFMVSGSTKDVESSRFVRSSITKRESSNSENITNNSLTREFERKEGKSNRSKDNIAQLFTINKDKYSIGLYVRSLDIHFASWPSAPNDFERKLPVKVYLKPVNNGYPSPSKIIAEKAVYDIETIHVNGVVNFKFDYPIYLEPGTYAIELETNSSNISVKTYVLPSGKSTSIAVERDSILDVNIGSFILPKNIGKTEKLNNEFLTFKLYKCNFSENEGIKNIIYTYDSFSANELRSHVEGSNIDSRFCSILYNTKSFSVNTNEKIPKSTNQQTTVGIQLTRANSDISAAVDMQATNIVLKGYKTAPNAVNETLSKNIDLDSLDVEGKYRNVSSSRYITKTVKSLQSSKNVSVIFDRNQPPGTQIEIYLKKSEPNSLIPFDDEKYIQLRKYSEDPSTIGPEDFVKTEYRHPTELSEFNTFAVKVIFIKNPSTNDYPSIKNLKVIAI